MTSLLERNEIISVSGFERATFAWGKNVIIIENGRIRYIDLAEESSKLLFLPVSGRATAMAVSNDFSIFAVATEEEKNSKVVVYSSEIAIDEVKCVYGTQHLPAEMSISQGAEIIACLSVLEERIHLQTFDVKDGINNCTGNILTEKTAHSWQMSFCPADEGVLCALGGGVAYLLRASGGYIENFSTIQLSDAICHDWANDVNIMFGTRDGILNIYRETILLEVVNIKTLSEEVLKDAVEVRIVCIRSSSRRFACQIASGIVLIFDSTAESGPLWTSSRAIILSDFKLKPQHFLSFDFSDEYLLYDDGRTLMSMPIRFLTRINAIDGDVVTVRHCDKIICMKSTDNTIITLDDSGFIVVFSKITQRPLCSTKIVGAFFFSILKQSHHLVVATRSSVEKVIITLDGLLPLETILEKEITMAVDSYDMSVIAVLDHTGFIVFQPDDSKILMNEPINTKKDIKQVIFSRDNKYLMFLTKSDHVFCADISTGKTLWSVDYKLHFFQSIAYSNVTLLLLNQKFIVTRIKHGKDLTNVNMHASDIGFSITSEIIEGNNDFVFISADCGELLCSAALSLDEPVVVRSLTKGLRINFMRAFDDELLIGYENGAVGVLELHKSAKSRENDFDMIFCKFHGVANLKSLLRDIDAERNMIRETTEKFMKKYTENKDEELRLIKQKFDETMAMYMDKVKAMESDFLQSEEIKKNTVLNLEELYIEESSQQKMKYEKMIEAQIRKGLRQMEEKQEEIKKIQQEAEKRREETIGSFQVTETQMNNHIAKLLAEIEHHKYSKSRLEKEIMVQNEKEDSLKTKQKQTIQKMKDSHREDAGLLEEEIWNLKATCVQLNEQRDRISDENAKTSSSLKISKQQIEHLRDASIKQENAIKTLQDTVTELRTKEVAIKKSHSKLQQKLIVREKQCDDVIAQNHRSKRRMQDLEARIEQLAGCVYDSRKLEHSVLALLAMSQNVDLDERYKRPI